MTCPADALGYRERVDYNCTDQGWLYSMTGADVYLDQVAYDDLGRLASLPMGDLGESRVLTTTYAYTPTTGQLRQAHTLAGGQFVGWVERSPKGGFPLCSLPYAVQGGPLGAPKPNTPL